MAIFTPGALVNQISGSIGTITFVTSGRGNIIRRKPLKNQHHSIALTKQQRKYRFFQTQWTLRTADQQKQWGVVATTPWRTNAFGVKQATSGYTLFMTMNLIAQNLAGDCITTPPPSPFGKAIRIVYMTAGSAAFPMTPWLQDESNAGYYAVRGARSMRDATLQPMPKAFKGWRSVGVFQWSAGGANIFSFWNSVLGALTYREWWAADVRFLGTSIPITGPYSLPFRVYGNRVD